MNEPGRRRVFRLVIPRYPVFNIYSHVAKKTTALGPVQVATSASKLPDWDVEVIDENNYRFPGPLDDRGLPDHYALQSLRPATVVGFYGGMSCSYPRLLTLASFYKSLGVLTIGGGQHLDVMAAEALTRGLDVVVNGEGENTVPELLPVLAAGGDRGTVKGVTYLDDGRARRAADRPLLDDFEMLPLADFGLLRFARIKVFPVNRIRGCGMNCEFCAVKGRARCASPEKLVAQISRLAEGNRARKFFIVDDQFAQDRDDTMRFCRMLREYQRRMGLRLRFTVQIRLDCAEDEELLAAMREAGIRSLAIGIESPIDEELRAMGKRLKAEDMAKLARVYNQQGFLVHGMFIFGYPMRPGVEFRMTARERVRRFRKFFRQARLDTVQVLLPVPLPGTALRERLEKENRVLPSSEIGWEYYDGNFPVIVPDPPLTPESMHHSIQRLMGGFYRFSRMLGVTLHLLRFPLAMLPLINVRRRWRSWYRHWRNEVIASGGYFVLRRWKKAFRGGSFREKLEKGKAKLE